MVTFFFSIMFIVFLIVRMEIPIALAIIILAEKDPFAVKFLLTLLTLFAVIVIIELKQDKRNTY